MSWNLRLIFPITCVVLISMASPTSAGLFRHRHRRCQTPDVPAPRQPPGQPPTPAPGCAGSICPQYTTESRPAGSTNTVLWYALKCSATAPNPVSWYGPYNHERGCSCSNCMYCEATFLSPPEGALELYVTQAIADGGIAMGNPQTETDFSQPQRNFSSRIVKFSYKGRMVVAQLIHIEHRPGPGWKWVTTEFGREVNGDPEGVPEKDVADKQPYFGKRLVVIKTKDGGTWQVMIDEKRPVDTLDKE